MELQSILTATSLVEKATNIISKLKLKTESKPESDINTQIISLQTIVSELNGALVSSQSEISRLQNELDKCFRQIADNDKWDHIANRYELKQIGLGGFAYRLKQGMEEGEPEHYVCKTCFQKKNRSILDLIEQTEYRAVYFCPSCQKTQIFTLKEYNQSFNRPKHPAEEMRDVSQ